MQINKSSWHYKLNCVIGDKYNIPRTLCPYFWLTLGKTLLVVMVVFAFGFASWGIGTPILTAILGYFGITFGVVPMGIAGTIFGATTFASIIGTMVGIAIGWLHLESKYDNYKTNKEHDRIMNGIPKKEPGILVSFLKAKKQKYCPVLEFVDTESESKSK